MSEELQLLITTLIDKEVENTRRAAWGGFGVEVYHGELLLQVKAQAIISKLIEPLTNEQIQAAETALAIVKKERNELIEDRKLTTARFTSVTKRLMKPEDSIEDAIKTNEAAILKAKQAKKSQDKLKEDKEKELKGIAEHVRVYVADMHAAYLKAQLKLITTAYEHAIENKIPLDGIQDYIAKVKRRITVANCTTPPPKPLFKYNSQEDVDAEIEKHFKPWLPQQYIDGFAVDVQNKFSDWELALKNPEQATKLNKEEENITVDAIDDNKEKETVSAKLEAIAAPLAEGQIGKELKVIYKIPEPQSICEALIIINAFVVNQKICIPELRPIKPINLSVKQMIGALEDIKSKDINFAVTGIAFIETEKL